MAEEATTTSSPAQTQTQTQSTETTASPLEKVYSEFKIEDQAATFQPEPRTPAQPAPQAPSFKAPDPFDPNFGQWQGAVSQTVTSLNQAVAQTANKLSQIEREIVQRKVEADIKQAAGVVSESAGIDPDMAEVHLEVTARKDPKFKSIWDNRDRNPKAFQAAIKAVAELAKEKYTVRQDPQLAENQRAMKVSQQQMATTTKTSQNEEWGNMSYAERQAKVRVMLKSAGR